MLARTYQRVGEHDIDVSKVFNGISPGDLIVNEIPLGREIYNAEFNEDKTDNRLQITMPELKFFRRCVSPDYFINVPFIKK